jgi:hypothetical protein
VTLPSLLLLQAGVRYATKNPYSYVHSNVAGHVTLLEAIRVRVDAVQWPCHMMTAHCDVASA